MLGHICAGQTSPPPPATETAKDTAPGKDPAPAGKDVLAGKDAAPPKDAAPVAPPNSKAYVIGSLDELEIKVYSLQNLNGFYPVSSDGTISMPLIGDIRADGMTKGLLAKAIADKLAASVLNTPPALDEISITVVRNNSKKYYVLGGVAHPGEFPLNGATTILDALSLSQPFHDFANLRKDLRAARRQAADVQLQGRNQREKDGTEYSAAKRRPDRRPRKLTECLKYDSGSGLHHRFAASSRP